MQMTTIMSRLTLALLPVLAIAAPAQAKPLEPSVVTDLQTIKVNADAIAAGRFTAKDLQTPARKIGLAWSRVEPTLLKNGDVLVETKMTNASITKLEADWQKSKDVRGEAKEVSSSIDELTSAAKS